jgi:hypothetical protein
VERGKANNIKIKDTEDAERRRELRVGSQTSGELFSETDLHQKQCHSCGLSCRVVQGRYTQVSGAYQYGITIRSGGPALFAVSRVGIVPQRSVACKYNARATARRHQAE